MTDIVLFVQSLLHLLAILERQQERRLHATRVLDNELVVGHAAAGSDGHAAHNEMVALMRREIEKNEKQMICVANRKDMFGAVPTKIKLSPWRVPLSWPALDRCKKRRRWTQWHPQSSCRE